MACKNNLGAQVRQAASGSSYITPTNRPLPKNLITHPGFLTVSPNSVFKLPFPSVSIKNDHRRLFAGQGTEKQCLLYAVQAAALVQAALVHHRAGLTIHFHVTATAGRRVPMTGKLTAIVKNGRRLSHSVVVTALSDDNHVIRYLIDQAMGAVNTAGPAS